MYARKFFLLLISLMAVTTGCGLVAPIGVPPVAAVDSATPVSEATPTATNTPPPTATQVPTATPSATPTPTPNKTATAQAHLTATTEAQIALIDAELQKYDLSTKKGHLGWIHDPMTLKVDTYMESKTEVDYPDLNVTDFVLQSDITWEGTGGIAGCGFLLRAEPDFKNGAQYQLFMARIAFRPLWDIEYYKYGRFQASVTGRILDAPSLNDDSGDTNRLTVIVEGDKITAYANGDKLGSAVDGRLKRGIVAFLAWQESGETICTFKNSWLWVLKD